MASRRRSPQLTLLIPRWSPSCSQPSLYPLLGKRVCTSCACGRMLQYNDAAQPKRQTRRLPTCGTSLSQAVHFAIRCGHSSWSAGAAALREDQVLEGSPEGSESLTLRLRSQGDLKPPRHDAELHSVLAREQRILRARAIRTGSRNLATQLKGVQCCCVSLRQEPLWRRPPTKMVKCFDKLVVMEVEEDDDAWRPVFGEEGVSHGVVPRCQLAVLPRLRGCSRNSCDFLCTCRFSVARRSLVASREATVFEFFGFSRDPA